jgi:hypothetical protein
MTHIFIKKCGLVLVTFIIVIIGTEIILRFFASNIIPTGLSHAKLGYIHRPNINFSHLDPESQEEIHVSINSEGFRDKEWSTEAEKRVLVVGDSFVDAMQVQEEFRFTSQLETMLNNNSTSTWKVYNLGVSGSGPESYIEKVKYFAPIIQPTHVVVAVFNGNDLQNINYNIDPNGGRKNYLIENNAVTPYSQKASVMERLKWELKIILAKFYIVQLTYDAIHTLQTTSQTEEPTALPEYCNINPTDLSDSLTILNHLMKETVSATDAQTLILDIPDKHQLTASSTDTCNTELIETSLLPLSTNKNNVPVIFLKDSFEQSTTSAYFIGHLNHNGHLIAARELYKQLILNP